MNSEALSLKDRKELFASYKEDYNTCTLPSLKYVDINMWEREEARKKAEAAAEKANKYERVFVVRHSHNDAPAGSHHWH